MSLDSKQNWAKYWSFCEFVFHLPNPSDRIQIKDERLLFNPLIEIGIGADWKDSPLHPPPAPAPAPHAKRKEKRRPADPI